MGSEKFEQMPTEWEQDVAVIYVNKRPLVRPDTNIKIAIISFLLFVLATCVFTWLVHYIIMTVSIITYFPVTVQNIFNAYPVFASVAVCVFIELFFCIKYTVIGIIKLYQHYAPEEIRRRCVFMPTCSEYAILAIRKYGFIIGLYKSYYRLFYRCRGNIYQIDYP